MESVEETPEEQVDNLEEGDGESEAAPAEEIEQVDLDQDYALARSAILLDTAGDLAIARRDPEEILRVGKAWIELAKLLGSAPSFEEEEDEDAPASSGIGFVGRSKDD